MSAISATEQHVIQAAAEAPVAQPGEYLAFALGSERYGIKILDVQEIRSYEAPTRIAGAMAHVKGVINLRGSIVPLVDMRELFGREDAGIDAATVVVVVNVGGRTIGAIVDAVHDVTDLSADEIKAVPDFGLSNATRHFRGLGSKGGEMVVLIDMKSLLARAADSVEVPAA